MISKNSTYQWYYKPNRMHRGIVIINKLILWYLKRNNMCFMQHGKYGWTIAINFHKESNVKLIKYTMEVHDKYYQS